MKNNGKLENINLNTNKIQDVDILKKNLPIYIKSINLGSNKIKSKDIEEIKKTLKNNNMNRKIMKK